MTAKEFRRELEQRMPGYKWTVHRTTNPEYLSATGTQSIGFNRLSTLRVQRRVADAPFLYTAKSAGYGLSAPWLHVHSDTTLARALRGLQDYYETQAQKYQSAAADLKAGREVAP